MAPKEEAKAGAPKGDVDMRSFVGFFPYDAAWTTISHLVVLSLIVIAISMGLYLKDSSEDFTPVLEKMKEVGKVMAVAFRHREFYAGNPSTMAKGVNELFDYLEKRKDLLIAKRKYYADLFESGLQTLEGWQSHGANRYYISKGKKTWHNAQKFCLERNAHLASIHTVDEQRFVSSQLRAQAWIGLSDADEEGHWRWSDDSWFTTQYWADGEPSDAGSRQQPDQDCAAIEPSPGTYNWKDEPCDRLLHWVCKQFRAPIRGRKQ